MVIHYGAELVHSVLSNRKHMVANGVVGCKLNWPPQMDFVNSANIHELEGCTSVDGHLRIIDASLKGLVNDYQENRQTNPNTFFETGHCVNNFRDPFNDIEPMAVEELSKLKSIKEITEYLLIHNLNDLNVTSFLFLSKLESILGRTTDK